MTTSLIIYRRVTNLNQLFAHCTDGDTVKTNGVAGEYNVIFIACMPKTDRTAIQQFTLSECRWPFTLPIVWDDTNEAW